MVVQRYRSRSWFCWNVHPIKGRAVDSAPRLKSTDLVQPLHVSVENTEAWRGLSTCLKSSGKSGAGLRPEGWAPTVWPSALPVTLAGVVAQAVAGGQKGVPQRVPLRFVWSSSVHGTCMESFGSL